MSTSEISGDNPALHTYYCWHRVCFLLYHYLCNQYQSVLFTIHLSLFHLFFAEAWCKTFLSLCEDTARKTNGQRPLIVWETLISASSNWCLKMLLWDHACFLQMCWTLPWYRNNTGMWLNARRWNYIPSLMLLPNAAFALYCTTTMCNFRKGLVPQEFRQWERWAQNQNAHCTSTLPIVV